MCNCGKKRSELKQPSNNLNKISIGMIKQPVQNKPRVLFQYTGQTALTVTGNVTRKIYRFNFSGDMQPVDVLDANGMNKIPVLKRV